MDRSRLAACKRASNSGFNWGGVAPREHRLLVSGVVLVVRFVTGGLCERCIGCRLFNNHLLRRHLDTAHDYGTEPDVGAAIKASGVKREVAWVATCVFCSATCLHAYSICTW